MNYVDKTLTTAQAHRTDRLFVPGGHMPVNRILPIASFSTIILILTVAAVAAIFATPSRSSHVPASQSPRSATTATSSSSLENQVQVLNAGLWRTDRGFNATIRVTNLLVVGPLEVVPVLYMADGTRYQLPPLKLPTSGESNVNVNDALRSGRPLSLLIFRSSEALRSNIATHFRGLQRPPSKSWTSREA